MGQSAKQFMIDFQIATLMSDLTWNKHQSLYLQHVSVLFVNTILKNPLKLIKKNPINWDYLCSLCIIMFVMFHTLLLNYLQFSSSSRNNASQKIVTITWSNGLE